MDAKSFRQRVLRPAEGVFLFHPRAVARLSGAEREPRRPGAGPIHHHLIHRGAFLRALETENPEVLSIIEGLPLPDWILLLPMPSAVELRTGPERTLLRDYWARRFEGELQRLWQMARDDNRDQDQFGIEGLAALIGEPAVAEVRDLLLREGFWFAADDEAACCRAFVARVIRLRYFAPGARGWFFPAVRDWSAVDRWLEEAGMDLPPPLAASRLPRALERARPAVGCGDPAVILALPRGLPFGGEDPDLASIPLPEHGARRGSETDAAREQPTSVPAIRPVPDQARVLAALRRGASIRRRAGGLGGSLDTIGTFLLAVLAWILPVWDRIAAPLGLGSARWGRGLQLLLLRGASARAQRSEMDGRFATALGLLAQAKSRYLILSISTGDDDPVLRHLEQRQWAAAEAFADFLAVNWRLSHLASGDLGGLIRRLVGAGAQDDPPPGAQSLLARLQTVLLEGRASYYRWDLIGWIAGGRLRQVLPFQGTLKALAALDGARDQLERLPWPQEEIDCYGEPLAALSRRIGVRLDETLRPRLTEALRGSGLVEMSDNGHLAAERLSDAMSGLIRRRWCLRYSDVRDLLNQDQASLPDVSWGEAIDGDRLGRFDRLAAGALPGVYRRGEIYVKGLQRLAAPLFGTEIGRGILRLAMLPVLGAWALVELVRHLAGMHVESPPGGGVPDWMLIGALGVGLSAAVNTAAGRAFVVGLWRLLLKALRLIFVTLPGGLLGSRMLARLLALPPVRAVWERVLGPVIFGAVPLLPVALIWWLSTSDAPGPAAWLAVLALAFALGTLIRDTPQGRRGLDDLASVWLRIRERLRHERLLDLITPVLDLFKELTRAFSGLLDQVRTALSPRYGEPPRTTLLKAMAAVPWAICEWLIQLYAVVLIEPQVNPVKHFPAVTLGHKLMLPMLPALTGALHTALSAFLPGIFVVPIVAVTIALLPGFFGFMFWELKEDWFLYRANRRRVVPPTRIGHHGENLKQLLRRGFHSGTLPKAFDALREELAGQIREERADTKALRRALAPILETGESLDHFARQELLAEIVQACPGFGATLREAQLSAASVRIRLDQASDRSRSARLLNLELAISDRQPVCSVDLADRTAASDPDCRAGIERALDRFAVRCGAASWSDSKIPLAISDTSS